MNDDERRVRSILAFTFKKLDEELGRPRPEKDRPPESPEEKRQRQEQLSEGVRRDFESS